MRNTVVRGVFVFIALCAGAGAASAATDTFMLVPGIPGGSVARGHEDWIDVISLQQSWPGQARKGTSCDVTVVKGLDIAGPKLYLAAVTGQIFSEIKIEVLKAAAEPVKFYELKLTNAIISSITTSGNSTSIAENVVISPQSATLSFFTQRADGSPGPPVTATIPCN